YAGGRQVGQAIELEVVRTTEQSHLAKLWQNDVFNGSGHSQLTRAVDSISKYFTSAVLAVAAVSGTYWYMHDPSLAPLVVTAVLIVACPCALALSTPFTFGSALRWFGKTHVYLKNTDVVESLANVDTVVFDKTGTLTQTGSSRIHYSGDELDQRERSMIASVLYHSTHPLSRRVLKEFDGEERLPVTSFEEAPGKGVRGIVDGVEVKAGSATWVGFAEDKDASALPSAVYVSIGDAKHGRFSIIGKYRPGVEKLVQSLRKQYKLLVLSGDHEYDRPYLEKLFGDQARMLFRQTPEDKLTLVQELKNEGRRVLMIGDGLNDAGALKAADVGISVAEDVNTFAPACDGIVDAEHFPRLDRYMKFARASYIIVMISFGISFLYNITGLGFAVTGMLSPLVSAILMPVSSVTIVAFALLATSIAAKRIGLVER
ncbi:MAG: HAD-IC family P-type ATPase, partial [Chlorobi bacterium]|nr:HAD-IC family P-type ATPase [Chlorobiota bacterium]